MAAAPPSGLAWNGAMGFDDDFSEANDLLAEAFGDAAASIVRAGVTVENVTVTPLSAEYDAESDGAIRTTSREVDFLVKRTAYDFGAGAVEPQQGDQIKRTIGGVVVTYQVAKRDKGRAAEWADPDGDEWLVHANRIDP